MLNYLISATGLRKFQAIIASSIILLFLIVSLMTVATYFKHHYIKQGRDQIIDQLNDAQKKQKKKDQEDINNAKQIDKNIGAMSNSDVRHSLQSDFRDSPKNRQDGSVSAMVKDQAKPQGYQPHVKADTSKQSETKGLLQTLKSGCYSVQLENDDGTFGEETEVCNDG
jgi:hypothetical protein